jgi:hypothetical protein
MKSAPALAVLAATAAVTLAACGGSGSHSASAVASKATVTQACEQVSAVLSDGPDPGADPIGYAQAQILPLRQLHLSDRAVALAAADLADAYARFVAAHGHSSTKQAVAAVNHLCPGAAG